VAELAALGPFFEVRNHHRGELPSPPWQSFSTLTDDDEALRRRVGSVRAALAMAGGRQIDDVEPRVAASVAQLGLVARILAPVLAVRTLGLGAVDAHPGALWWEDRLGGPFPLSVCIGDGDGDVIGPAVVLLTARISKLFDVSPQVVWGNVGSAANSAAAMIAKARPDLASVAAASADAVLTDPRIDGGTLRSGPGYRRRSCCLIYRLADDRSAACGDCVLRDDAA
jgi:hypothetical protein